MNSNYKDVTMYVCFNFGSFVYLTVRLYEGKSIEECVRMRSEDIDEYRDPVTGEWKSAGEV